MHYFLKVAMFRRRNLKCLIFVLAIVLVMLTLHQRVVFHIGQENIIIEQPELDTNFTQRVPSIDLNKRILQTLINSNKFIQILKEASEIKEPVVKKERGFISANVSYNKNFSIDPLTTYGSMNKACNNYLITPNSSQHIQNITIATRLIQSNISNIGRFNVTEMKKKIIFKGQVSQVSMHLKQDCPAEPPGLGKLF
jgi:hypothetical protein